MNIKQQRLFFMLSELHWDGESTCTILEVKENSATNHGLPGITGNLMFQ